MSFAEFISRYDYDVAPEHIATKPARPRDSAKLLVSDPQTEQVQYDTFLNLDRYVPRDSLFIFNNTKVIPARLPCSLPTGGTVELLWVAAGKTPRTFEALSPRILQKGTVLRFNNCELTILSKRENIYRLAYTATPAQFKALMMRSGKTPIPPYLKNTPLKERALRAEYQAIFARREGSVAAPTASLHFTTRVLSRLKKKGVHMAFVTLHVNLGTFAPLTEKNLDTERLHEEFYEIPASTRRAIDSAKKQGRPVIPVGTTALRAIESAAINGRDSGTTDLFIQEGYRFKVADGLITNFHVPRSSLVILVSALLGRTKTLGLYRDALRHGFRFFSFGDAMLIRPPVSFEQPEDSAERR